MSTLASTSCTTCGAPVPYEPIMLMGRDIGKALAQTCDDCARRDAAHAEAQRKETWKQERFAMVKAIIPPEFQPLDFDENGTDTNYPEFPKATYETLRKWLPGPRGNSLGLFGPSGFCKTRILALLAARFILMGNRVVWTTSIEIQDAAETFRVGGDIAKRVAKEKLTEATFAPMLIIDDLGKNEWPKSMETRLFQILSHRQDHRLPTLWSANAHPKELGISITKLNSDPIVRRLTDRTTHVPIPSDLLEAIG